MRDVSLNNFGIIIAYLLPGFTALWGIGYLSGTVATWLGASAASAPTVGGFLYVTLASLGTGMIVNAVRWLTLDRLHHSTGVRYPSWDFAKLQENLGAYDTLVEFYYRYYEFFGNTLVAGSFTYVVWRRFHLGWQFLPADCAMAALAALCFVASRDTLQKYYRRSERLLAQQPHDDGRGSSLDQAMRRAASDREAPRPEPSPAGQY